MHDADGVLCVAFVLSENPINIMIVKMIRHALEEFTYIVSVKRGLYGTDRCA